MPATKKRKNPFKKKKTASGSSAVGKKKNPFSSKAKTTGVAKRKKNPFGNAKKGGSTGIRKRTVSFAQKKFGSKKLTRPVTRSQTGSLPPPPDEYGMVPRKKNPFAKKPKIAPPPPSPPRIKRKKKTGPKKRKIDETDKYEKIRPDDGHRTFASLQDAYEAVKKSENSFLPNDYDYFSFVSDFSRLAVPAEPYKTGKNKGKYNLLKGDHFRIRLNKKKNPGRKKYIGYV